MSRAASDSSAHTSVTLSRARSRWVASLCCCALSSRLWCPRLAATLSLLVGTVQPSPSWAHGRRRPARRWRASAQTPWRSCGWWICPQTVQTHLYVLHALDGVVVSLSVVVIVSAFLVFPSRRRVRRCLAVSFFFACVWRVASSLRWPPGHPLMTHVKQSPNPFARPAFAHHLPVRCPSHSSFPRRLPFPPPPCVGGVGPGSAAAVGSHSRGRPFTQPRRRDTGAAGLPAGTTWRPPGVSARRV